MKLRLKSWLWPFRWRVGWVTADGRYRVLHQDFTRRIAYQTRK